MKKSIAILLFGMICFQAYLHGQIDLKLNVANPSTLYCGKQSDTYKNHYRHKEYFVPDEEDAVIKTIHINFIVWQRANGSGNLFDDVVTRQRIRNIFKTTNTNYERNTENNYGLQDVLFLPDTKIRIQLDSIYFIQDLTPDSMYYYGKIYNDTTHYAPISDLQDYMNANHPESMRSLNYHFTGGKIKGAGGFANGSACQSFYKRNPEMNVDPVHDWWFAFHLAHELAHCMDLQHTYERGYDPATAQNCNPDFIDFLSDVYDLNQSCKSGCEVCLLLPKSGSNNIMSGNQQWLYFSRLQLGVMHRALMTDNVWNVENGSIRNYATGYSTIPKKIREDETWDFTVKMYQDLVVKKGTTLTLRCKVEFVPQASLIIEPGARVIIDGGKLTNEWHYKDSWQGVKLKGKREQHPNPLSLINGGVIEYALYGIQD